MPALPRLYTGGTVTMPQYQNALNGLFSGGGGSGLSELMQLVQLAALQQNNAVRAENTLLRNAQLRDQLANGRTDKEREAIAKRRTYDQMMNELVNDRDFLGLYRDIQNPERSFHGRLKLLQDAKKQYIDPIAKRYGMSASDAYKDLFAKDEAYLKSEAERIQGLALDAIPARIGLGATRLYHELANILPWTDEQEHAQAILKAQQEAEANNEYLKEQAKRASEGEGLWSRTEGLSGWLSEIAESVPELASFLVPGKVVTTGARLMNVANAARAGRMASWAGGAGLGGSMASLGYAERVLQDQNLTEQQKQDILNGWGHQVTRAVGSLTGALAPDIVGPVRGARLRVSPAYRAADKAGREAMRREADNALINQQLQRGKLGAALANAANVGAGMGLMGGGQQLATNIAFNAATGRTNQNSPIMSGVWDSALSGAITGGLLGAGSGAHNRYVIGRQNAALQAQQAALAEAQARADDAQAKAAVEATIPAPSNTPSTPTVRTVETPTTTNPDLFASYSLDNDYLLQYGEGRPTQTQYSGPIPEDILTMRLSNGVLLRDSPEAMRSFLQNISETNYDSEITKPIQETLFDNFPTKRGEIVNRLADAVSQGISPDYIKQAITFAREVTHGKREPGYAASALSKAQVKIINDVLTSTKRGELSLVEQEINRRTRADKTLLNNAKATVQQLSTPQNWQDVTNKLNAQLTILKAELPKTPEEIAQRLQNIIDGSSYYDRQTFTSYNDAPYKADILNTIRDITNHKIYGLTNAQRLRMNYALGIVERNLLSTASPDEIKNLKYDTIVATGVGTEAKTLLNRRGLFNDATGKNLENEIKKFITKNGIAGLRTLEYMANNSESRLAGVQRKALQTVLDGEVINAAAKSVRQSVQEGAVGASTSSDSVNSGVASTPAGANEQINAANPATASTDSGANPSAGLSGATPQDVGTPEGNPANPAEQGTGAAGTGAGGRAGESTLTGTPSDASTRNANAEPGRGVDNAANTEIISQSQLGVVNKYKADKLVSGKMFDFTPEQTGAYLHNNPSYYTNNPKANPTEDLKQHTRMALWKYYNIKPTTVKDKQDYNLVTDTPDNYTTDVIEEMAIFNGYVNGEKEGYKRAIDMFLESEQAIKHDLNPFDMSCEG